MVVADDHPFFRDGVTRGLLTSGLITVVGEAGTGREALELIESHHPDVALVDYQPIWTGCRWCTPSLGTA
ncbi:MAG TPA: response regulator [Nakamurella sp.]|nr:response regulator [Nakamurella sp.]